MESDIREPRSLSFRLPDVVALADLSTLTRFFGRLEAELS